MMGFYRYKWSERLGAERQRQELSQTDLAYLAGVAPGCVCAWEKWASVPRFLKRLAVAQALGVNVHWLQGETDERD